MIKSTFVQVTQAVSNKYNGFSKKPPTYKTGKTIISIDGSHTTFDSLINEFHDPFHPIVRGIVFDYFESLGANNTKYKLTPFSHEEELYSDYMENFFRLSMLYSSLSDNETKLLLPCEYIDIPLYQLVDTTIALLNLNKEQKKFIAKELKLPFEQLFPKYKNCIVSKSGLNQDIKEFCSSKKVSKPIKILNQVLEQTEDSIESLVKAAFLGKNGSKK
ncbi:hypothetical protein HC766_06920 [Candidatus Gracilibacteria bacterium]|nr:hypothetical protein [Candidatus Gracilibacteria bacterium]